LVCNENCASVGKKTLIICQEYYRFIKMTGTLQEHPYAFFIISRPFMLRMKNVSDTSCGENGELLIMPANSRWDLIRAFKG
jgi:hypothetical protein